MTQHNARLTTEQLAVRFDISTNQVRTWKGRQGFPADAFAIDPETRRGYYDLARVETWLRSRDYSKGRKPRWLAKLDASGGGDAGRL